MHFAYRVVMLSSAVIRVPLLCLSCLGNLRIELQIQHSQNSKPASMFPRILPACFPEILKFMHPLQPHDKHLDGLPATPRASGGTLVVPLPLDQEASQQEGRCGLHTVIGSSCARQTQLQLMHKQPVEAWCQPRTCQHGNSRRPYRPLSAAMQQK